MFVQRMYYEFRIVGKRVILIPLIIMLGFALAVLCFRFDQETALLGVIASIEMGLPLAAGFLVAAVCSVDPGIEWQLALPIPYMWTLLSRLGLIVGCTALIAIVATIIGGFVPDRLLLSLRVWPRPLAWCLGQLSWLAPLFWFVSISCCLTLFLHSWAASTALLTGIWITDILIIGKAAGIVWLHPVLLFLTTLLPTASFWLTNRWELIGTALLSLALVWWFLKNHDALLQDAQGGEL